MTILYFTSTGNCLHVAKTIGGDSYSIAQAMKDKKFDFEDDVVGLVFPIYGVGMPKIVQEFIANAKIKAQYTFAIGTYGKMAGAALWSLQKFAQKHGIHFDYTNKLLMVDNFLPLFSMENELTTLAEKQIDLHLSEIIKDILARKKQELPAGFLEKAISTMAKSGSSQMYNGKYASKFYVDAKCTKCQTCAKVCPSGNIEVKNNVTFKTKCQACLACVHMCPHNAIHIKGEKSEVRFRNENTSLAEIIDANNQR